MKKRLLAVLLSLIMLIGLMPMGVLADGETLYVNNASENTETPDGSESKPFTTVAAAIEAAGQNDTIKIIATDIDYDAFRIPSGKGGITIEGVADSSGAKPTVKTCYEESPTWAGPNDGLGCGGIDLYSPDVTLKGLKIVNYGYAKYWHAASVGYYYEDTSARDNLKVDGCEFVGRGSGTAICYHSANFTLTNSSFEDFDTAYLSCNDNSAQGNVTITENSYDAVDTLANIYYGKAISDAEGDPCITITNNTVTPAEGETSEILITDHAQKTGKTDAGIKAVITGNTDTAELLLECVNMNAVNDIVLDDAAAQNTTVYHRVTVNNTNNGYADATVTDSEGKTYNVGSDGTAILPVSGVTFKNESGEEQPVPDPDPVTVTYTTAGGVSTTVEAAVVAADPTDSTPAATLNGVDENGNATDTPVEIPDADSVYAAQIGENKYASLSEAINDAEGMDSPVIEILGDLTIDEWDQVWSTDAWTIDGGGNTVTVEKMSKSSLDNGGYLFYNAADLTVKDLNVVFESAGNGLHMSSGTLNNVKMTGAGVSMSHAVYVHAASGNGKTVTIENCAFTDFDWTVYSQPAGAGQSNPELVIRNSQIKDSSIGVLSYAEKTVLDGNTISDVNEISLAGALDSSNTNVTYEITGNTLEDVGSVDLHDANLDKVTFTENKVDENSRINATANSTGTLDVNNNYWGGGAPSKDQIVIPDGAEVKKDVYYETPGMQESDKNTYVPENVYRIKIDAGRHGDVTTKPSGASEGTTITVYVEPDKGYALDELTVTDREGNELELKDMGDGRYRFRMPDSKVNIEASFKKAKEEVKIVLTVGSNVATVNGETVTTDVAPVIVNGRSMLPIRFIAEALGAEVEWVETERKVIITKGDVNIVIFIGSDYAYINGEAVKLDAAAFIEGNRTYLPLRFIAEALGAEVVWDPDTRTVTITGTK